MIFRSFLVFPFTAAVALATSASEAPDPYAGPISDETTAMIRAGLFGEPGADARIEAWLRDHRGVAKDVRARLAHRLCGDYDVHSAHASAAIACNAARTLGGDDVQAAASNARLRDLPPIRAIGSARVALTINGVGSRDTIVQINGVSAPWIVDTGAQVTVVSASLAKRIGVRIVKGKFDVGSVTGAVQGELGVIDLLAVGDARVENVPVLVLPDAQLKIGDLPQIQAILGLPVLVAFRRAAWLDHGATLALGDEAPVPAVGSPRLYWHEEGLGLPITTPRGTLGAMFDSGANDTTLRAPSHALFDTALEATAVEQRMKVGGAAGTIVTTRKTYPVLTLDVAGASLPFHDVPIDEKAVQGAASLGDDVVKQLTVLTLDFEQMTVSAVVDSAR